MPPPPAPRILLVRFGAIGDVLLTTPLIRVLRLRHPEATLTALTKAATAELLADNPRLDRVLALEPGQPLARLAREIRGGDYTHRLDLHGSVRSRILRLLAPGNWTGYRKRRRARAQLIRTKVNLDPDPPPVAERYFEAARTLDVRPDGGPPEFWLNPAAEDAAARWIAAHGFDDARLLALAPGAAHATKRWPLHHWVALVQRLAAQGFDLVVVGGPDEHELCGTLAVQGGAHAASAAGEFGLQGTGALIGRARALVSGDTGAMHMATGVGTPVLALFGPTVRAFGFFPYHARGVVMERELPCRPCSSKGTEHCPAGHHRCLEDITAGEVEQQLRGLVA